MAFSENCTKKIFDYSYTEVDIMQLKYKKLHS